VLVPACVYVRDDSFFRARRAKEAACIGCSLNQTLLLAREKSTVHALVCTAHGVSDGFHGS